MIQLWYDDIHIILISFSQAQAASPANIHTVTDPLPKHSKPVLKIQRYPYPIHEK